MSLIRNGAIQSSSFKSAQSYENYQPQYFGVRSIQQPKRFTTFNSAGLIQNHHPPQISEMFPTATSIKSIPPPLDEEATRIDTFKNIMLIAVSNKWTEKDIATHWTQVAQLIKNGFQGSRKELNNYFNSHRTPDKKKRSRSQEQHRVINTELKRIHYQQIKPSPKLQRFHSLNYDQPAPLRKITIKQKAKSVEGKRKHHKEPQPQQSKQEGILKLCHDIEFILGEGERRLAA